jgi:hypothetical protein
MMANEQFQAIRPVLSCMKHSHSAAIYIDDRNDLKLQIVSASIQILLNTSELKTKFYVISTNFLLATKHSNLKSSGERETNSKCFRVKILLSQLNNI